MTEQDKVTVDDIIGIVKTEEQTNSVEEVRKLRGRENKTAKRFRFNGRTNCIEYDNESILLDSYGEDIEKLLNELHEEKEDMQGEIDHCHRIIETLVAQKGVTDYMDLLNLCDKDILIENGWEIWEEEE